MPSNRTFDGPLLPERHAHIQRVADRVRRVYDLAPGFWKIHVLRTKDLLAEFGKGEDRAEALALIVGICLQRGIQRKELQDSLGIANGTVARYALIYKEIPEETKLIVRQLAGEQAAQARRDFLGLDDGTGNSEN